MKNKLLIIGLILLVVGLICYFSFRQKGTQEEEMPWQENEMNGIANPASAYCEDQGGEILIKTFESGQRGFCLFNDASQCDEWDFFNGNCSKGQLKIEVLQEGTGKLADDNNTITVHYSGFLEDGTKFDSSVSRGEPFVFVLGTNQVIKGWDQGVLGMQVGEKRKLTIAPELAYGQNGIASIIPANATLIFDVELLEIQ